MDMEERGEESEIYVESNMETLFITIFKIDSQ